jgi:hypothetical protein
VLACLILANMKHALLAVSTSKGRVLLITAMGAAVQARDAATSCSHIHPRGGLCNDPESTSVHTCVLLPGMVAGAT